MAKISNLENIFKIKLSDYQILLNGGTVQGYSYDPDALYIISDSYASHIVSFKLYDTDTIISTQEVSDGGFIAAYPALTDEEFNDSYSWSHDLSALRNIHNDILVTYGPGAISGINIDYNTTDNSIIYPQEGAFGQNVNIIEYE